MKNSIPFILFFSFIVMFGIVFGCYKFYLKKRQNLRRDERKDYLKMYGKKMKIKLDNCEIKSTSFYEQADSVSMNTRTDILNSFIYPSLKREVTEQNICVLQYSRKNLDGSITVYNSNPINISLEALRYKLITNKETYVYVDPQNNNEYYFDLEFLYNNAHN